MKIIEKKTSMIVNITVKIFNVLWDSFENSYTFSRFRFIICDIMKSKAIPFPHYDKYVYTSIMFFDIHIVIYNSIQIIYENNRTSS